MKAKTAMTLVELLVTLSIVAMVALAVSVSTSGLDDRRRDEVTRREGEAMVAALESADGLSFVSDLGFVPRDLGELRALATPLFISRGAHLDANLDYVAGSEECTLDSYRVIATNLVALLPEAALRAAAGAHAELRDLKVSVGAGWRGPYLDATKLLKDDRLVDGWGGYWDYEYTNGIASVTSYGRDLTDATTRSFTAANLTNATVNISFTGLGDDDVGVIQLFSVFPSVTYAQSRGRLSLRVERTIVTGGEAVSLTDRAIGTRLVFALAGADLASAEYHLKPCALTVRPGINTVTFRLRKTN